MRYQDRFQIFRHGKCCVAAKRMTILTDTAQILQANNLCGFFSFSLSTIQLNK